MKKERRRLHRRAFSYYMRVLNHKTGKPIGHLADISADGFQIDTPEAVPLNVEYKLRLEVPPEMADKNLVLFVARCRWCRLDPADNVSYNAGFQVVEMSPDDQSIFHRMFEKYGSEGRTKSSSDYLWK